MSEIDVNALYSDPPNPFADSSTDTRFPHPGLLSVKVWYGVRALRIFLSLPSAGTDPAMSGLEIQCAIPLVHTRDK